MKTSLVKTVAAIGLAGSLTFSSWGIITNGTVEMGETGEIGGVSFEVDFGSVEVSDLSGGGLRFNRGSSGIGGSQITTENLAITSLSELSLIGALKTNLGIGIGRFIRFSIWTWKQFCFMMVSARAQQTVQSFDCLARVIINSK